MELSLALAFGAGLVSFVTPCVLALVPVYVAFLAEAAGAPDGTAGASGSGRVLLQAALFVGGFSALFVVLGVSAGLVGVALLRAPLTRELVGVAVMAIGVLMTGVFGPVMERLPALAPAVALPSGRATRSVALGGLVALGWTPCIGPVLGAILAVGASSQDIGAATVLLLAYSAGLAVPFLAAAVALPRLQPVLAALRRHHRSIQVVTGLAVVGVGGLIVVDAFSRLASFFAGFGL